ncbi:MAG TPA: class IIb bacteriocin, lactobin A/cerein 7B family [Allosphingosinicella sp.]|jgi:lactobin A/cerein 7B family class IIb bacteriocin
MIHDLTIDEMNSVNGGEGEVGDAIRAVGEVGATIVKTAYDAGYMLGSAIRGIFT